MKGKTSLYRKHAGVRTNEDGVPEGTLHFILHPSSFRLALPPSSFLLHPSPLQ